MLASGYYDNTIILCDTVTNQKKNVLKGHTNYISALCFSPDGNTLASGSYDNIIKIWNTITFQEIIKINRNIFKYITIKLLYFFGKNIRK